MTLAGSRWKPGSRRTRTAYPKISLEAAQTAARQQDERKELYGFLSKGGEQTFGGA